MDGLAVLPPVGDPDFGQWRRDTTGALPLDGFFALHPALAPLLPLWESGELGFAHAVCTPYRDRRSHFDGQDLLEAGLPDFQTGRIRDGWLNRVLQSFPGARPDTAFAIGFGAQAICAGDAEVSRWAPAADLVLGPQTLERVQDLMRGHPLFGAAMTRILDLASCGRGCDLADAPQSQEARVREALLGQIRGNQTSAARAGFAAEKLRGATRIATFSIGDWDTHADQARALQAPLSELATAILTLKAGLGPVWATTAVVAMTEFGRTVQLNGTKGTDHGTAGAMLFAGGAIRERRVLTDWPGLAETDLYDRRDLRPTRDLRDHCAWLLHGLFGLERGFLETTVFPGLVMGNDPGLLR